jgi:hypothetical protein
MTASDVKENWIAMVFPQSWAAPSASRFEQQPQPPQLQHAYDSSSQSAEQLDPAEQLDEQPETPGPPVEQFLQPSSLDGDARAPKVWVVPDEHVRADSVEKSVAGDWW